MSKELQQFIININPPGSAKVRHDTMEGRDYLVAPAVILTEGVHIGSDGPGYYSKDVLSRRVAVWNHKPVVVYHPEMNGVGVTACDPVVLTNRKVGILLATEFDGRLKTEVWCEVERLKLVDNRVKEALENNQPMEVSTGIFVEKKRQSGIWNEEAYEFTVEDIDPDHLAILPDKVGACSLKDGAGLLVNKESGTTPPHTITPVVNELLPLTNEVSHSKIRRAIQEQLVNGYLEDVYSNFFIYSSSYDGGKYAKQDYSVAQDGTVSLGGNVTPVMRVIEYRTQEGSFVGNASLVGVTTLKEKSVEKDKKEKIVNQLISNGGWVEGNRDILMALSDDQLVRIETADTAKRAELAAAAIKAKVAENTPIQNMTPEQYIEAAPAPIRELLTNGLMVLNAERLQLIQIILANKLNTFTEENLKVRQMDELRQLAQLAGGNVTMNYAGAQGFANIASNQKEIEETPLVRPTLSFEKKSA